MASVVAALGNVAHIFTSEICPIMIHDMVLTVRIQVSREEDSAVAIVEAQDNAVTISIF